jgi:antitoxin (DNA-binding transcriptional repressor) of toxin-antitoxin stability system
MSIAINAKRLRASLPDVVERVRKGTRFTDPLYRAESVGRSRDGRTAADHDTLLYGR